MRGRAARHHPRRRIERLRERLVASAGARRPCSPTNCATMRFSCALARSLHAINPLATVARGYAILQDAQGRVVRGIDAVAAGDRLQARLHDGRLDLRWRPKGRA